jgi:hypothetical protein
VTTHLQTVSNRREKSILTVSLFLDVPVWPCLNLVFAPREASHLIGNCVRENKFVSDFLIFVCGCA